MMAIVRVSIGVLGFVVLGACSGVNSVGGGKGPVKATLNITKDNNSGLCTATTDPYRVKVKKNGDVEFAVNDTCGATNGYTVDVELLNWKEANNVNCDDGTQIAMETTKGKRQIASKIKAKCKDQQIFKYEIWVGGKRLADPELEIAP
jgi:hypothetical protein